MKLVVLACFGFVMACAHQHQNATCRLPADAVLVDYPGKNSWIGDSKHMPYEYKIFQTYWQTYPCKFSGLTITRLDEQPGNSQPPRVDWLIQGYYAAPNAGLTDYLVDENGAETTCKVNIATFLRPYGNCPEEICEYKHKQLAGKGSFSCSFLWNEGTAHRDSVVAGHGMSKRIELSLSGRGSRGEKWTRHSSRWSVFLSTFVFILVLGLVGKCCYFAAQALGFDTSSGSERTPLLSQADHGQADPAQIMPT